jgi:hypothetical protein
MLGLAKRVKVRTLYCKFIVGGTLVQMGYHCSCCVLVVVRRSQINNGFDCV